MRGFKLLQMRFRTDIYNLRKHQLLYHVISTLFTFTYICYVHLRILETPVKRHKQTRHFSSSGGKRSSGIILHLSSFWQLTVVARGGIIFRKLTPTTPLFPSSSLNLWEWGFRSRRVSYLQKKSTHVVRTTLTKTSDVANSFRRMRDANKDWRLAKRH